VKPEHIIFPCGNLKLEGMFYKTEAGMQAPAVVICHPHPLYGGSMHNNVTYAIAGSLVEKNISAMLFNFRGVGGSQGYYGDGVGEQEDVDAALNWLKANGEVDHNKLGLAGYSFGAAVALPVACTDRRVTGIALISPYLAGEQKSVLNKCERPVIVISGDTDDIVLPEDIKGCLQPVDGLRKIKLIQGADHFWTGYETEMADAVAGFFRGLFFQDQGI
jgi:alpha/beta superfamily hydrolase